MSARSDVPGLAELALALDVVDRRCSANRRNADWATLLRRVYDINALACSCGGRLRFSALVTKPEPVCELLVAMGFDPVPPARAPPRQGAFGWDEPA